MKQLGVFEPGDEVIVSFLAVVTKGNDTTNYVTVDQPRNSRLFGLDTRPVTVHGELVSHREHVRPDGTSIFGAPARTRKRRVWRRRSRV